MPVPKKPLKPLQAKVALTVQVPVTYGLNVDGIAQSLGVSRHKLLLLALNAGLPLVAAQAGHKSAADPPPAA